MLKDIVKNYGGLIGTTFFLGTSIVLLIYSIFITLISLDLLDIVLTK